MLLRLFTIIALAVFVFLIAMGSDIESALFKGATVFIFLVIGTRFSVFLVGVIKENPGNEQESHSHN